MINPYAFLSRPFWFGNICKIYPPTINQILDNKDYYVYLKMLLTSQEDIEDELTENKQSTENMDTPLDFLFKFVTNEDKRLKTIVEEAFNFFIHEPIFFLPEQKMIIIGNIEETLQNIKSVQELRIIQESNYFEFQNMLRLAVGKKQIEPYNPDENPKIKYFKAKARLRDRVKEKNAKDGLTLGTTLAAICCMGLGLTPLNVGELSQSAVSAIMRMYQEKNKYDIDIQSLLAGADKKKVKPQFWIRNIEDL